MKIKLPIIPLSFICIQPFKNSGYYTNRSKSKCFLPYIDHNWPARNPTYKLQSQIPWITKKKLKKCNWSYITHASALQHQEFQKSLYTILHLHLSLYTQNYDNYIIKQSLVLTFIPFAQKLSIFRANKLRNNFFCPIAVGWPDGSNYLVLRKGKNKEILPLFYRFSQKKTIIWNDY